MDNDIDPILHALGAKGRYQYFQMLLISLGSLGAAYQLFDNVFIGLDVPFRCAAPRNTSALATENVNGASNVTEDIHYEECQIRTRTNTSASNYSTRTTDDRVSDCIYGYHYEKDRETSFVSDFDLVCDQYLLASLAQTMVILGQGIGAVTCSMVSDRYGRRPVLLVCQLMLFVVGVAIGLSPNFPVFAFFKVVVGIFQQGVVTGMATMLIELFTQDTRSLITLIFNLFWAFGTCTMALTAYLLRHHSWRILQHILSAISVGTVLIQLWLVDESLRWLIANGKVTSAVSVLKRASRTNRKDFNAVLDVFHAHRSSRTNVTKENALLAGTDSNGQESDDTRENSQDNADQSAETASENSSAADVQANSPLESKTTFTDFDEDVKRQLEAKQSEKLTVLDLFRHKHLLINVCLTFSGWFTAPFVLFTLILMSTSYYGSPHLNYFLTALMDIPPAILLYLLLDRIGRKRTVQFFFGVAGLSVLLSAVCRTFKDSSTLDIIATVFSLSGVVGGSGAFASLFFYTPEYFPTNLRNQAIGISSTVGRLGGMIAPFMKNIALIVIWAPGVITGSFCVLVMVLYCFLPETRGRELPNTIADIKAWYSTEDPISTHKKKNGMKA